MCKKAPGRQGRPHSRTLRLSEGFEGVVHPVCRGVNQPFGIPLIVKVPGWWCEEKGGQDAKQLSTIDSWRPGMREAARVVVGDTTTNEARRASPTRTTLPSVSTKKDR